MSSNQTRLKAAFDRLVKSNKKWDEIEAKIEAAKNRGDQAGEAALGLSGGDSARICCDGSTSDSLTPGVTTRDPDSASQTGLDPNDPARLTAGDGTLSGVTDCATGEPVCMDGSGFIPPDGWDAPNEPPIDPEWVIDDQVYWSAGASHPTLRTKGQAREYMLADSTCDGTRCVFCYFSSGDDSTLRARYDGSDPGGLCNGSITYQKVDCSIELNSEWCGTDKGNPTPEEQLQDAWPSDGCVNLARKSGTIVGSKYDPDQSGAYNTPKTSIQLCDNANGTSILYQPLPGGGFRTIESSAGVAVSGAVGYTYSADGTLTGTITQAEWDATAP